MNRTRWSIAILCLSMYLILAGCGGESKADPKEMAPPPAVVEHEDDVNLVTVDRPERFTLSTSEKYESTPSLNVTGVVQADISRAVPVISLAAGRVIEVHARLGDAVTKGQLLMKVQSADIAAAYSDYQQALADQTLAHAQLDRAKILYEKGATAQKDLEVAVDASAKADVTVRTTLDHLRVLGADPDHPSSIVDVRAPVSGVITDQQVTNASGVQGLGAPNPFTISDLSNVWIVCDVYENDLDKVRLGEFADVQLNAYPNRVFKGRIGNIGPVLDPNLRTAKVRLEMANPGLMRVGMFVTAAFHGLTKEIHTAVPAGAILHLHDREWVYIPAGQGKFRRLEVVGGNMLAEGKQEILSGLDPGQPVVSNALMLQDTVEQ